LIGTNPVHCFFQLLDWYCSVILKLLDSLSPESDAFYLPHPTHIEIAIFYILILVSVSLNFRAAWIVRILAILYLTIALSHPRTHQGDLEITMLDIGQAECIHISYPDGSSGLIDVGSPAFPDNMVQVSERIISRYLWELRIKRLDYILLTHPERDHIGAFSFIARNFRTNNILYSRYHPAYEPSGLQVDRGYSFVQGGVWHGILHPDLETQAELNVNDSSVVTEIRFGRFSALFTGDITNKVETALSHDLNPVVLLKIPHHGSRSSSSKLLLTTADPKMAWISSGRRNPFRHPSQMVLQRLFEEGIQTLCTAESGSLRLRTNGFTWKVQSYSLESRKFVDLLEETLLY